jgi:hypothetical protein
MNKIQQAIRDSDPDYAEEESDTTADPFAPPSLGEEDYADHTAKMVANAFEATELIEIVEVKAGIGEIHLMGRVKSKKEPMFLESVVKPILYAMQGTCNGHVGKQFLLKRDEMRYGWVISFASNDLKKAASAICESIAPLRPKVESDEAPLMGTGAPQSGGRGTGRKGASPLKG